MVSMGEFAIFFSFDMPPREDGNSLGDGNPKYKDSLSFFTTIVASYALVDGNGFLEGDLFSFFGALILLKAEVRSTLETPIIT